jgi:hypothetical protein
MEKMLTTKRLSVRAEKPQDQTCASKAQEIIGHILDDQTTGLSDAVDAAVYNSVLYGSSIIKMANNQGTITATIPTFQKAIYSPRVRLNRKELETHPAFELTVEQLRAAWMIAYGSRWISMEEPMNDDYLNVVTHRLISFGELEVHDVIDQYTPMGRIKL